MRSLAVLILAHLAYQVQPLVFSSAGARVHSFKTLWAAASNTVDVGSLKRRLATVGERVAKAPGMSNLKATRATVEDLEADASQDGFWDDAGAAQKTMQELETYKSTLARMLRWEKALVDCETALEFVSGDDEKEDEEFASEAGTILGALESELEALDLEQLLSGPFDKTDCRVVIIAGAGGTDAQDWAQVSCALVMTYGCVV